MTIENQPQITRKTEIQEITNYEYYLDDELLDVVYVNTAFAMLPSIDVTHGADDSYSGQEVLHSEIHKLETEFENTKRYEKDMRKMGFVIMAGCLAASVISHNADPESTVSSSGLATMAVGFTLLSEYARHERVKEFKKQLPSKRNKLARLKQAEQSLFKG